MNNFKSNARGIIFRVAMALFLAVALLLPNYAKAFESQFQLNSELSQLVNSYLDIGAEEAYGVVPAIAIPASLAAAGVTTETFAAASAALFTALAGVSLVTAWEDLLPTDKAGWGTKENYVGAQLLGVGVLQGWLTPGEPSSGEEPPEFNGDKGNKVKEVLLKLATGAVGSIALAELGFMAKDLVDFVASAFGEDENGLPTGLGALSSLSNLVVNNGDVTQLVPLVDFTTAFNSGNFRVSIDKFAPAFANGFLPFAVDTGSSSSVYSVPADRRFRLSINADGNYLITYTEGNYDFNRLLLNLYSNVFTLKCYSTFTLNNTDTILFLSDYTWANDVITNEELLFQAANLSSELESLRQQVASAGVGSSAADSVINNYVTNNIDNSSQYVTVPSTLDETSDYTKVVVDVEPSPSPDPEPEPDPTPEPTDESLSDKAKKFLDLPVQQLFPFCLVYDIQLIIEHVAGSAPAALDDDLVFELDFGFGYFDAPLVVDLTDYRDMQNTFHAAFDILLVLGLLYFSISLFLKARGD